MLAKPFGPAERGFTGGLPYELSGDPAAVGGDLRRTSQGKEVPALRAVVIHLFPEGEERFGSGSGVWWDGEDDVGLRIAPADRRLEFVRRALGKTLVLLLKKPIHDNQTGRGHGGSGPFHEVGELAHHLGALLTRTPVNVERDTDQVDLNQLFGHLSTPKLAHGTDLRQQVLRSSFVNRAGMLDGGSRGKLCAEPRSHSEGGVSP